MDIKDFIINQMLNDLDDAYIMERMNYRNHVDSIDKLLGKFKNQLFAYTITIRLCDHH